MDEPDEYWVVLNAIVRRIQQKEAARNERTGLTSWTFDRKELRVNQVRRRGNGWLGRAATRGRMRSRDRGYVGSEKARGPAKRRMAQWLKYGLPYGKAWR